MTTRDLDRDLIDHACGQLARAADRHTREGLGPASAARAAIRETSALFPHDWRLAVQGDDDDDEVEVWEVEHKRAVPCARISRESRTKKRKVHPHKLTFEGRGPSTMGRCACGEVFLSGLGHGTERQQVRAQHERHLANVGWMESLPK